MSGEFSKLPPWLNPPDYSRYLSDNYVVLDFETTLADDPTAYVKSNQIVCATFRGGPKHPTIAGQTLFVYGNEYCQEGLVEALEKADFWVAHNSKFEYGWLERCGLPLEKSLSWCTQIAEYVIKSNRRGNIDLASCLRRRGMASKDKLGSLLLKNGVCPSLWPIEWISRYNIADVDTCEKLFLHQREAMKKTGKIGTLFTRCIFTPCLVDIEKNGLCLDKERVERLHDTHATALAKVVQATEELIGGANMRSPKQMAKVLYEDFGFKVPTDSKWLGKNGDPTTKSEYINSLPPKNKKQKALQDLQKKYSQINAALTKSLTKFLACVRETDDGILYAELLQTRTDTQRLASRGKYYRAQMQNFARIFKPLFKARYDGWFIGELDQAQLEYRVAVFLGQDEAGLDSIIQGVDRHAVTAEKIFGKRFTEPKSKAERDFLRTDAKSRTFKPLYGGESGTNAEKEYYAAFKAEHKGVVAAQTQWKTSALNSGRVTIPSGLTFYFPDTKITETGYITNSTSICNYPVQSFATADIVPVMVTGMWYAMRGRKLKSFLVNTIHDSVITETHPEEKEIISELGELFGTKFVYIYLKEIYNVDFNVPLEVETKFASHWNDSEYWRDKYLVKGEI